MATTSQSPQRGTVLLKVEGLTKYFPVRGGIFGRRRGNVRAVDGVDLAVRSGETLGLVGESGCGKSTVGRTILHLYRKTRGRIVFDGRDLDTLGRREMRALRRDMQIIFQDPYESLNARHTVGQILEEPYCIHRIGARSDRNAQVCALLQRVGLPESAASRFPHEFSGGQRQRIGIARALALDPRLIICDEPVSALDVSIQSQILNLLLEQQQVNALTYIFISHDLAVVKHMSDRIAVMYLGKIVEFTDSERLYRQALHPYTHALISAIPVPDPTYKKQRIILSGDVPSPQNPPSGCRFHTRCSYAQDRCRREEPVLRNLSTGTDEHLAACHFAGDLPERAS